MELEEEVNSRMEMKGEEEHGIWNWKGKRKE